MGRDKSIEEEKLIRTFDIIRKEITMIKEELLHISKNQQSLEKEIKELHDRLASYENKAPKSKTKRNR